MDDFDKRELQKEKKTKRIMKKSAYGIGFGIGLYVLKFLIAPFIGDHDLAREALGAFALCLLTYGITTIAVFIFKKDWLAKADFLLSWIIIPMILLKLVLDLGL